MDSQFYYAYGNPRSPAPRSRASAIENPPASRPSTAVKIVQTAAPRAVLQKLPKSPSAPNNPQPHKDCRLKRIKSRFSIMHCRSASSHSSSFTISPPLFETDSLLSRTPSARTSESGQPLSLPSVNMEYAKLLEKAIDRLKTDFVSGARQMADSALSRLPDLIKTAAVTANNRNELWQMTVYAANKLSGARPSMNAAIASCLLRVLDGLEHVWDNEQEKGVWIPEELVPSAITWIDKVLERRKETAMQLNEYFIEWVKDYSVQLPATNGTKKINILTLSNSSTIRSGILTCLSSLPDLTLSLHILESRPRFEGAGMASQILSSTPYASKSRLHIRILPDCAVGTAAKDVHLVLLGADRISASGDVSNKIGSLAAALSANQMNKKAQVVVVSDGDKIVPPGTQEEEVETHPESEMMEAWRDETRRELDERIKLGNLEVFGEWFEWVPAKYIDTYITEHGILDTEGVERLGMRMGELKERIFGKEH